MSYLLEVPVSGGKPILVEVTDPNVDDLVPASKPGAIIGKARTSLEAALAELQPTMNALSEWAESSAPDEFTVEFGLKLGGTTNVIIASGTAEVNFIMKMTWKR
jgi:NTP-dependent ternary system trypsin peptidase co-occuring protein